jgi:hypothetical protein
LPIERLGLGKHVGLEPLERGAGLDPELLDEVAAGLPEGSERVRRAATPVVPDHQQSPQPFPERVLVDQALEAGDGGAVATEVEVGLQAILEGGGVQLVEADRFEAGEVVVGELGQSGPPAELHRLIQHRARVTRPRLRQQLPASCDECFEPDGVELRLVEH